MHTHAHTHAHTHIHTQHTRRWNKHGTCALSSLPDEHAYFKAILDLNTKYDLEVRERAQAACLQE